ncbi:unnamed protein product [Cuscuta campestris]|uniref:CCHC-type domain-containing protein n=1 Tax=Cuscuta campestris TaxID=132261 RepID=A0A484LVH5_9ASTE|nr:unnamed protein product [Cuscuta campestris]
MASQAPGLGHGGSHRQRPAIKKTFTDILGSQPSEAQNRIGRYRGFPVVSFTPDEVISLSIPYQFALVGRFLKSRPPLEVIRKSFEQIGFKPGFTVGLLSPSLILINFECTIDYQRCFSRRLWNINGSQMVVTKWTPSFHADSKSPVFPIWVSLTHLPIHLQDAKALHSIASSIGHPLMMDAYTAAKTRPSMARFCVEIDISKDLPKKIWIDDGGLGFFQLVTYENLPEFCIQCKKSGHLDGKCSTMDNLISKNELSKNNLSKTWCPISKHEVSKENLPKTAAMMIEPILNIPCELGPKLDSKTSCDTNLTDPSTAGHEKSEVDHHVSDLSPEPKGDELTPQEAMEINLTAFCKEDNPNTQALNVQSDFPTDSHNDVQNSGAESGKELLTTNTAAVVNQDGVCDPTDATVSDEVDEQSEAEAQYDMEKLTKEADLEHTQEQIIEESMDGMTAQNAYCVGNTINLDEFPVLTRQNIEEDVHTPTENVETVVHTPTEIEKDDTTGTITLMAEDTTKETTSPNIPDTNIGPILHSFELEVLAFLVVDHLTCGHFIVLKEFGEFVGKTYGSEIIKGLRIFLLRNEDNGRIPHALGEVRLSCAYYSGPVQETLGSNGFSSSGLCRMSQAASNDGQAVPHGEPEHVSAHKSVDLHNFAGPRAGSPGRGEPEGSTQDHRGDLAVALLQDSTYDWWKRVGADVPEPVQWATFDRLFHEEYILEHFVEAKREEFLKFTQGELTLPEYRQKFDELAGFGQDLIPTMEKRCKRFVEGLRRNLSAHLITAPRVDINAMFKHAVDMNTVLVKKAEYVQAQTTHPRPPPRSLSSKRSPSVPSSSHASKKTKSTPVPSLAPTRESGKNPSQSGCRYSICTHCGQRHPGECWFTQGLCLGCGQAGHFRTDCPTNPGEAFKIAPAAPAPAA